MKKFARQGVMAGIAILALTVTGCSSTPAPAAGGDAKSAAEITFLTFKSPNLTDEFWKKQVAEIQKTYPKLKVKIEYTPGLDRQGYAKQLLATGNLPDVIWDAPLNDFVKANALLPYETSDLTDISVPTSSGAINGKHYSLTLGAQVIPAIYYNKDDFSKLGISTPKTFAQLETAAEKIKAAGKTPFLIGGGADSWASTIFLDGIITSDVLGSNPAWQEQRKAGKVKFSDAAFASAVTKWKGLFDKGYFNSDALTVDYSALSAKFANGQGVMYPMGSWAGTTKASFSVGVFPLPGQKAGQTTLGLNYGQALAISAKTKFPAQARAFAVALATGKGANEAQLNSDSLIPVVKAFTIPDATAPLIKDSFAVYKTAGAKNVDPFEWTQGANALPSGFNAEFDKGAQGLISGQGTVSSFLTAMDKAYDDLNHQ